jgi:hypothetical protein
VAAFTHLSLRPATKIANIGHPAGPVSGGTKEVPVAMLAGSSAVGAGV